MAAIEGSAGSILTAERTALNFLGHLSGVATATARYVQAVEGTGARILDTRKTTPGLRALEKQAVRHGGGVSHRGGLYDAILVKENHARAGGRDRPGRTRGAGRGVTPRRSWRSRWRRSTSWTRRWPRAWTGSCWTTWSPTRCARPWRVRAGRAALEASGGITLDTIRAVAETGVDFISVGALTHSAPALDLSLSARRVVRTW